MASRVIIKKAGAKKGSRSQVLSFVRDLADRQLSAIANKSAEVMRQKVDESITRADSSGDLKESIYAVRIDSGHYGVGDISFMNVTVPYWAHCLDPKTEVYIYYKNKVIPIELKKLEKLFKKDKNIKLLSPTGFKKIYKIDYSNHDSFYDVEFSNFCNIRMSPNHRLLYKLANNYLDKPIETFGKSFKSYSGLFSFYRNFDNIIKEVNINDKLIKLDYLYGWVIGFTLGDGCVSDKNNNRISWSQKELDSVLPKLKKFTKQHNGSCNIYKDTNKFNIYSTKNILEIVKYFCIGKHKYKRINNFFLNTPEKFRLGILDGYNDSDGRKTDRGKNRYCIRTVSKKMRKQLVLIGASLGYDCSIYKPKMQKTRNMFYEGYIFPYPRKYCVKKNTCKQYSDSSILRVTDKTGRYVKNYNKIKTNFKYFPKTLKKLKKVNKPIKLIDLQVEDSLFIINGGIVSHNTNFGSVAVGASHNHRVPVGGFNPGFTAPNKSNSDQRWFVAQGGWSFVPKKPIAPRNYIAKTITEQNRIIAEVLNTVR